jgi:hypothetical protein
VDYSDAALLLGSGYKVGKYFKFFSKKRPAITSAVITYGFHSHVDNFVFSHVKLLAGHDLGRCCHLISDLVGVAVFADNAASSGVSDASAAQLQYSPFHQRSALEFSQILAGHQPHEGGGPLFHLVIFCFSGCFGDCILKINNILL